MAETWMQLALSLGLLLTVYNTVSIIYIRMAMARGSKYPSTVRARLAHQARRREERRR